jgi:hypothetical protein
MTDRVTPLMQTAPVSFGQSSGPPASAKQVAYLLSLLQQEGYAGFRDARGPLGLTQRQGGGKFTTKEASSLIDQLVGASDDDGDEPPEPATIDAAGAVSARPARRNATDARSAASAQRAADRLESERIELLRGMPAELLAAELERRGWSVTSPADLRPR